MTACVRDAHEAPSHEPEAACLRCRDDDVEKGLCTVPLFLGVPACFWLVCEHWVLSSAISARTEAMNRSSTSSLLSPSRPRACVGDRRSSFFPILVVSVCGALSRAASSALSSAIEASIAAIRCDDAPRANLTAGSATSEMCESMPTSAFFHASVVATTSEYDSSVTARHTAQSMAKKS